ncbi:uncharacterized protein LOC131996112 [Stomoxys calcitrans]|uniref:uncharacterized protein LOC131996112 n=1 Tax=Stomoxys calcitrans TaxID=35570 RepID=UPI0027E21CEC|nr:uncharacterized protein LOC131996112 [Stomoxys calcitrans]
MDGYVVYRQNREAGAGGGTAVLVRETFRSEQVVIGTGLIESCASRVWRSDGSSVVFVSMYLRPQFELRIGDLDSLVALAGTDEVLIGCDLNAKHPAWGGAGADSRGRLLHRFLIDSPEFDTGPTDEPTRPNGSGGSHIDLFLWTPGIPPRDGTPLMTHDFESDHRAVRFPLALIDLQPREPTTFFNFPKMNVRRFRRLLGDRLPAISLPTDSNVTREMIDVCIEDLSSAFGESIAGSTPRVTPRSASLGPLPSHILRFIQERKRLRRVLHRSGDPGRHLILRADIRNLGRIIEGAIYNYGKDRMKERLERIRVNSWTYGKVKSAAGLAARERIEGIRSSNGSIIFDDRGKAECLAETLDGVQDAMDSVDTSLRSMVDRAVADVDDGTPLVTFSRVFMADGSTISDRSEWSRGGLCLFGPGARDVGHQTFEKI